MLGDLDQTLLDVLLHLALAYVVALPLAWERDKDARTAGIRTFPLVSLGACSYLLLARELFGDSPEAQARILQGLLTGMGFIGGGAILKTERSVHGVATAASLWNTGAIGAAVAFDRIVLAIVLALGNLLTFALLDRYSRPTHLDRDELKEPESAAPTKAR